MNFALRRQLQLSVVTRILGLLMLSLLAIVELLFIELMLNHSCMHVKNVNSEQKKDTLKREAQYPSNGSSSRKIGIDLKLPDTIKSRDNNIFPTIDLIINMHS